MQHACVVQLDEYPTCIRVASEQDGNGQYRSTNHTKDHHDGDQ